MFNGFYGLSFNPFDKQESMEGCEFHSEDFREMTARLNYIKDIRGIALFTAPPGFGKTFALRSFTKSLNPNLYQSAYICLSTVSVTAFYRQLCGALNIDASQHKDTMFKAIQERLFLLFKEKRRPLVLAIDEAHDLDSRVLKDLKMIMNYAYDSLYCFTVVLLGEPHLNRILEKPIHEALRQRITIHYNFSGLSAEEANEYIRHKLSVAGGSSAILTEGVFSAVYGFSQGNPRLIDNVMSDALTLGAQLGKQTIDTEVIFAAVENQLLQ